MPLLDPVYGVEGYLPALWRESSTPPSPSPSSEEEMVPVEVKI